MRKIIALVALCLLAFAFSHFPAKAALQAPSVPPIPPLPPIINSQNPAATTSPVPQLAIVIDPAHGAGDNGARGANGINEKDIDLALARGIRAELTRQGYRVNLTRDADTDPSFDDRDAVANAFTNAIFICIHVASTGTPGTVRAYYYRVPTFSASTASGTSTPPAIAQTASGGGIIAWRDAQASYVDASHRLAGLIQSALAQSFSGSPTDASSGEVRELRSVAGPAVAIEISNVTSPNVSALESMSPAIAAAIAQSIAAFHPGGTLSEVTGAAH